MKSMNIWLFNHFLMMQRTTTSLLIHRIFLTEYCGRTYFDFDRSRGITSKCFVGFPSFCHLLKRLQNIKIKFVSVTWLINVKNNKSKGNIKRQQPYPCQKNLLSENELKENDVHSPYFSSIPPAFSLLSLNFSLRQPINF